MYLEVPLAGTRKSQADDVGLQVGAVTVEGEIWKGPLWTQPGAAYEFLNGLKRWTRIGSGNDTGETMPYQKHSHFALIGLVHGSHG